jgi:GNAT superfamily N-acetyltransferase
MRHVRPSDAVALSVFYAGLSDESRHTRFFGACHGITDIQAQRFARVRGRGGDGFVVTDRDGLVVAHLCLEPAGLLNGRVIEEIGVAVADDRQGNGLGRALLAAAIESARRRGVTILEAEMLTGNPAIHALLQHAGLPWTARSLEPGTEVIRIELERVPMIVGAA